MSGGRAQRRAYYLAGRYLGMSPERWDALPWWQQLMYFEGYEEEEIVQRRTAAGDPTIVSEEVHRSGGTTITDRRHEAVLSGTPGELAAFGIRERTI